jgi:prepilin-type N-terminal cleavage/methylation domain-containing protein
MTRSREAGFSLIEIMVALALSGLLFAAIISIQGTVLRSQSRVFGQTIAGNQSSTAMKAFQLFAGAASFIQAPAPGNYATAATLWENFDGAEAIDPASPARFHHFCVKPSGSDPAIGHLLLYEGSGYPMAPVTCGNAVAGMTMTLISGGVAGTTIAPLFYRPLGEDNLIQFQYSVNMPASGGHDSVSISGQSQIEIQGPAS